jgi:hypothetical protein
MSYDEIMNKTYISPLTGTTYEYSFSDACQWERWDIYQIEGDSRKWVNFTLAEENIPNKVRQFEVPEPDVSSPWD